MGASRGRWIGLAYSRRWEPKQQRRETLFGSWYRQLVRLKPDTTRERVHRRTASYVVSGSAGHRQGFGANASSTLPTMPPNREYPELTYTMPPTTTAPGPSSDPPLALMPFTASYSRTVSTSHTTCPSLAANARRCPSSDPENTTSGI